MYANGYPSSAFHSFFIPSPEGRRSFLCTEDTPGLFASYFLLCLGFRKSINDSKAGSGREGFTVLLVAHIQLCTHVGGSPPDSVHILFTL